MNVNAMRVLLIGHDPADARAVREALADGQGYYFSQPLVAEQFVRLLETGLPGRILE